MGRHHLFFGVLVGWSLACAPLPPAGHVAKAAPSAAAPDASGRGAPAASTPAAAPAATPLTPTAPLTPTTPTTPATPPAPVGPTGAVAPSAPPAREFLPEAMAFYRAVACGDAGELPPGFDAAIVSAHCTEMSARYERFRTRYVEPARAFFAAERPAGVPARVVYPFGGGDLVSALVTFPGATEITTISLEHAGDPTRLVALGKNAQRSSLAAFRAAVRGLLTNNDSTSENMRKLERGGIPGQLSFHLTGAAVMGYVPVSLKYFVLDEAGAIRYLTAEDVEARRDRLAKRKKGTWVDPDFSDAYTNMELTLRSVTDATAPVVVHRHLAANLANPGFVGSPLEKHLLAKGKVAAMTKAASYLLWLDAFSAIRGYLTAQLEWMASDATGVPARAAKAAGLAQRTYGRFAGAFLPDAAPSVNEMMVRLWSSQPFRKLAFRYGYPDSAGQFHLMITERPTSGAR